MTETISSTTTTTGADPAATASARLTQLPGVGSLARAAKAFPATSLWNDSADPAELADSIARGAVGATCNPVIALTALQRHPEVWHRRIAELAAEHPTASESELGWLAIEALSVEAAALLRPTFLASGGRNGRLSIQTDPRLARNRDAIVAQAVHFAGLTENIIVKIPATSVGIQAIEEATFQGVSVNVTVSFTVAQALAAAEAIERGLQRRAASGLPEHEFGSVVTIMGGRLDDWIKVCADRQRLLLPPGVLDWAGIAVFKRAYGIFQERGYRSRLLAAAFRHQLQWSELMGGKLVISPPYDWQLRIDENELPVAQRIDVPVAPDILNTLVDRVPEFRRAWDPDGLTVAEFDAFGATRATLRQFLEADAELDAFVRNILIPAP